MSDLPVLLVVLGTRPEAIKLGTVIPLLRASTSFRTVVMWTGQHPLDDLGKVAELFEIKPDVVMPQDVTRRAEWTMAPEDEPDAVLVQGDTRSTAFGAMIARTLGAKLIHLEAGLRCWDNSLPEEQIRVMVDEQADLLLCPSRATENNAWVSAKEGAVVRWVGQTGLDALAQTRGVEDEDAGKQGIARFLGRPTWDDGVDKILLTVHRAARTDSIGSLYALLFEMEKVAQDHEVIWPVHPRIRELAKNLKEFAAALEWAADKFTLCDPIPYEVLAPALDTFAVVVTDSGGLVEECAALQVPCVIVRPNTERVEPVGTGHALLCPVDEKISASVYAAATLSSVEPFVEYGVYQPRNFGDSSRFTVSQIEGFIESLKESPDA